MLCNTKLELQCENGNVWPEGVKSKDTSFTKEILNYCGTFLNLSEKFTFFQFFSFCAMRNKITMFNAMMLWMICRKKKLFWRNFGCDIATDIVQNCVAVYNEIWHILHWIFCYQVFKPVATDDVPQSQGRRRLISFSLSGVCFHKNWHDQTVDH